MATRPRVFTIPASAPFLPALIAALMEDRLGLGFRPAADPLALADVTIYLPTRRACRLARRRFLEALGTDAAILPRLIAIGDIDEDELALAEPGEGELAAAPLDLPEPLDGLLRRTLLAELILKWAATPEMRGDGDFSRVANSPATALALAGDLARLMDDMVMRQVPWERLDDLVPDDLDEHWQKTLRFLKIAHEHWPSVLQEHDAIEPAERRDRLIKAEAARLAHVRTPVIAAGSTGSTPATASLLATIARLPHGALVLPGLDTDLDRETWELIGDHDGKAEPAHSHPQFAMRALLRRIGIERQDVLQLASPAAHGRERLVSEALRPAAATEQWQARLVDADFAARADAAVRSLAVIEAANAEEEALAIAIALREVMEDPRRTAALVTPDRALARRVLAALARWGVPVDDSGGDSLADTPPGVFARLVAEVALGGVAPVPLLALLKHPLCSADAPAVAALERAILRGPRPRAGTAGLAHALDTVIAELDRLRRGEESALHRSDPRLALRASELDGARALIDRLGRALAPLESLSGSTLAFREIAQRHAEAIAALGGMTAELADAFDDIAGTSALAVTPADYSELFHAAIADRMVRRPESDVRVRIFGLLEARLQTVDRLVLGGLVEGVWPPETRPDPWLSRPMRRALGLDLPERRVGLTAHDFAQALGAPEVILTRAAKIGGTPTVASRFMQRLAAVVGEERWAACRARGERYAAFARALDTPEAKPRAAARPCPKPPLAARPMALSVTEIEHWLRDPYTIYAKHVLRLVPLDAVDTPPGAADRGTVIHAAISDFTRRYASEPPADPLRELLALGRRRFAALEDFPEARAFWWPRFERIARWFVGWDAERRRQASALHAEIRGAIEISLGEKNFTLRGIADRIERLADGSYAILDYKTGRIPGHDEVKTGLAPQLTLEAAMLRRGGFPDISRNAAIAELGYVALKGGDPAGEPRIVNFKGSTPDTEADRAYEQLVRLAEAFANPDQPYASLVHPMWKTRYGDYDHLARVKEWSLTGGADVGSEGGEGGGE
jgi:ATP-dependent helicase/nuclease subunit B